jgi:DNA polymerase I-like protein with 3'-5' exonuclease and polymerase domains
MILSGLFEPDRQSQGLASWGEQFGVPKPAHEDWSQYSEEMAHRNTEDVRITTMLWDHLQVERTCGWDWEEAIQLEYDIAEVHARQEMNGVGFNRRAAIDLKEVIEAELKTLTDTILVNIPKVIGPKGEPVTKPFKVDGNFTKQVTDWVQTEDVSGPFTRLEYSDINLNSHQQVKDYLLTQGWVPTEFTDKGSPKLTEDSFDSVEGEVPKMVTRRNVLLHRTRMIENTTADGKEKGLLNLIRKDGRITAAGIPQGTPTGRYRHIGVVNIPRVGSVYGAELRALFIPRAGWMQLGVDASALEARMEAHYCYNYAGGVEYANELLDGDIHQKNADKYGCTRAVAKGIKYACSYGAQPKKISLTLKCSVVKARKLFNNFWKGSTALAALKEDITKVWLSRGGKDGGFIKGLDGRKLYPRSEHSIVNMLFQSAGSITVKKATVLVDREVTDRKLKAKQMLHFHDEFQYEVHPKDVEVLKEIALQSFVDAGKHFSMHVPIAGEAKTGLNWAECH